MAGAVCGYAEAYQDEQAENGKKYEMDNFVGMQAIDPGRRCDANVRNESKEGNQASPKQCRYPTDQFHYRIKWQKYTNPGNKTRIIYICTSEKISLGFKGRKEETDRKRKVSSGTNLLPTDHI